LRAFKIPGSPTVTLALACTPLAPLRRRTAARWFGKSPCKFPGLTRGFKSLRLPDTAPVEPEVDPPAHGDALGSLRCAIHGEVSSS
jgi:hypothetical protein